MQREIQQIKCGDVYISRSIYSEIYLHLKGEFILFKLTNHITEPSNFWGSHYIWVNFLLAHTAHDT